MASDLCKLRLRKEYKQLTTNPVDNIRACPKETNILEWHYVIQGAKNSDFEGGYYHGNQWNSLLCSLYFVEYTDLFCVFGSPFLCNYFIQLLNTFDCYH